MERISNSNQEFDDALIKPDNFGSFVKIVMQEVDITFDDVCDEFQVSKGIVRRWSEGTVVPRPRMREYVISRLAQLVSMRTIEDKVDKL